ncbi:MAG TPA: hypothetical protein VKT21_06265 [Thermoplasmata archaeon]|nr:hypothetical protein [Thermoplasmata archaeon]
MNEGGVSSSYPPPYGMKEGFHPLHLRLDVKPSEQPARRPIGEPTGDEMRFGTLLLEQLREAESFARMIQPKLEEGNRGERRSATRRPTVCTNGEGGRAHRALGHSTIGPREHSMSVS